MMRDGTRHPHRHRNRRTAAACAAARFAALTALVAGAACAPARAPVPVTVPGGVEPPDPALPAIPASDGTLRLDLVYPPEDAALAVRDSTFVFGSVGTGAARLTINGSPVPVEPNGAFLAFLPVPEDGVYRLRAATAAGAATLEREVELPAPPPRIPRDSAVVLEATISPRGAWAVRPGERIEVSVRGTPGAEAWLVLPGGRRLPMRERPVGAAADGASAFELQPEGGGPVGSPGVSEYRGFFAAEPLVARDTSVAWPALATRPRPRLEEPDADAEREAAAAAAAAARAAPLDEPPAGDTLAVAADSLPAEAAAAAGPAVLELIAAADTARAPLPLNLVLVDPDRPRLGHAFEAVAPGEPSDDAVIGRPGPGLTYHYFWPDATALGLTGERNGQFRVRLTSDLSAWVAADEVRLGAPGAPPPGGTVGTVRFTPYADAIDVRFALDDRLPFRVDQDERSVSVTLYGAVSNTDWLQYGGIDPLIERAEWSQPRDDEYRLTLRLSRRPWGYRAFWAPNGDLIVRVRRPPEIDPDDPLDGLLIAVDPGHPPGGAIGPTRWTEAEANLAISLRLRDLLEDAGARVLMTRTDTSAVPIYARTGMATAADAHVLLSVHNNAFPDGVDPFENNGTSVYYFHGTSVDLARELQRELLGELRLRNLGIGRANLALVRATWMPAALTETMFLMVPRQEAALRDPDVQERIARAHLRALERFLRGRALER